MRLEKKWETIIVKFSRKHFPGLILMILPNTGPSGSLVCPNLPPEGGATGSGLQHLNIPILKLPENVDCLNYTANNHSHYCHQCWWRGRSRRRGNVVCVESKVIRTSPAPADSCLSGSMSGSISIVPFGVVRSLCFILYLDNSAPTYYCKLSSSRSNFKLSSPLSRISETTTHPP